MEHSTPAALVDHMMTWRHEASGGAAARGRGKKKDKKKEKMLGESESARQLGASSSSSAPRNVADGRDSTRATLILLGFSALVLFVMCVTLAVALYLQRRSVGAAREERAREMMLEMGGGREGGEGADASACPIRIVAHHD